MEGISEEIHEMRKSRDSLDTILYEREEGVGAESPVGDLSRDGVRPGTDFNFKELGVNSDQQNKPCYGFKIALVSASSKTHAGKVVAFHEAESGMPVGERDGDPEGCSSVDEQQWDVSTRHQDVSKKSEPDSGENNSATFKDGREAVDTQSASLFAEKDPQLIPQQVTDPASKAADDEVCFTTETGMTNQQLAAGKRKNLNVVHGRDIHTCEEAVTHDSTCTRESPEQRSSCDTANKNGLELLAEGLANKTTDNYETCHDSVKEETTASQTVTELQSEVSIVPLADDTEDEEATRTILEIGESDLMEEDTKQQVLNKNITEGSGELLEQESSIPCHRMTVEERHESEILPNSGLEPSSHSTEECSIATPSC